MASPWRRLDALVGRAVARQYSEVVALQPTIAADYTERAPDPSRPAAEIKGIFSLEFSTDDLRGQRLKGEFAGVGRAVLGAACLQVMASAYAALGYAIREDDRIVLTERDGGPAYAVAAVHPLGDGDVLLVLTRDKS